VSNTLHDQIEAVESGYEFLLAYAAQGRENDKGSEVRDILTAMRNAANEIDNLLSGDDGVYSPVVVDDARKSVAAISLVLSQEGISSELVDNLNASIHLRALLTDLFLLSETID
jgi:hypothetical protein